MIDERAASLQHQHEPPLHLTGLTDCTFCGFKTENTMRLFWKCSGNVIFDLNHLPKSDSE